MFTIEYQADPLLTVATARDVTNEASRR